MIDVMIKSNALKPKQTQQIYRKIATSNGKILINYLLASFLVKFYSACHQTPNRAPKRYTFPKLFGN